MGTPRVNNILDLYKITLLKPGQVHGLYDVFERIQWNVYVIEQNKT